MSLFPRKPRPIKRHEATFRDDRLFIVACDDTFAPKQYFEFYERLLTKHFPPSYLLRWPG